MTHILIFIGFLIASVIEAIEGCFTIKKYKNSEISPSRRIKIYKTNIITGWLKVIICIVLVLIFNFSFKAIGINLPFINIKSVNLLFAIITYVASGGLFLLLIYQISMFLLSSKYRDESAKVMESKKGLNGADTMIPRTKKEKKWFSLCAFTAGVGEEIVYRGFQIYLLLTVFSGLNIYIILVISSLLFGFLHMYQGFSGFIRTALIGILLGALYISTGSLLLSIILHFTIDFAANFVYEC